MYTPVSIFKCVQGGCFCNNNGTKNNDHNNNSDSSTLSNPYVPGTRMCDVQFSRWLREGGIINHISPIGRLRHRGVRRSAHGHVADKWHSWEFSSRLGGFRSASHWGGTWFEGKTGHNCVQCHRWGSTCTGYWVCVGPLALTVLTGEGSSVGFSEDVQGKSPKARFAFSAHLYRSGAEWNASCILNPWIVTKFWQESFLIPILHMWELRYICSTRLCKCRSTLICLHSFWVNRSSLLSVCLPTWHSLVVMP